MWKWLLLIVFLIVIAFLVWWLLRKPSTGSGDSSGQAGAATSTPGGSTGYAPTGQAPQTGTAPGQPYDQMNEAAPAPGQAEHGHGATAVAMGAGTPQDHSSQADSGQGGYGTSTQADSGQGGYGTDTQADSGQGGYGTNTTTRAPSGYSDSAQQPYSEGAQPVSDALPDAYGADDPHPSDSGQGDNAASEASVSGPAVTSTHSGGEAGAWSPADDAQPTPAGQTGYGDSSSMMAQGEGTPGQGADATSSAYQGTDAGSGQQDTSQGGYRQGEPASAGTADRPYGPGSASPAEDGSGPQGWAIKGNSGSMLFHNEDSPSYQQARAEVWFQDEDSAKAAGFKHWDRKQR